MAVATATVRAELEAAAATLAAAGVETARVDAEWLMAEALGVGRLELYLTDVRPLPPAAAERFAAAVRRRARREPLQQIVGWQAFRGLRLRVTPDVLVPRPETEVLAGWALELLPPPAPGRRLRVLDLGTGSGCLACAIASERGDSRVVAVDVSPAAARLAAANARALGLAERVRVVAGDCCEPLGPGPFDLIVANPPYLPTPLVGSLPPEVRLHEPAAALDGGLDGLTVLRRVVAEARVRLAPGGALALETAGADQTSAVVALLREAGFVAVAARRDLAGVERLVAGRAPLRGT